MIHISGVVDPNTDEYKSAVLLQQLIIDYWPTIKNSSQDHIYIVIGAKCHGQIIRDIDLVVLGIVKSGLSYQPYLPFVNTDGEIQLPDEIIVESFCWVIEVKSHSGSKVQFNGTNVSVSYSDRPGYWHNASQQNEGQKQSLANYLRLYDLSRIPWITPMIWLRNVSAKDLPKRPHNILGGEANWGLFINVAGQLYAPKKIGDKWILGAGLDSRQTIEEIALLLTREIKPTQIDRRRMEQINQQMSAELGLSASVGKHLLMLRGRGGTGKTANLLQLAKYLYDDRDARILILTYNRALVADLRRLMTIMGIGDGFAERSIQIQTVHSFFYQVMRGLEIFPAAEDEFLEKYTQFKQEAFELLSSGAVTYEDIQSLTASDTSRFAWDFIFVDEGQDWPKDERDILFKLFAYNFFVIADGIDQLIRDQVPANWRGELTKQQVKIVPLKRCVRMKMGLTQFVSSIAAELGLQQSEWEANQYVPGGRVHIFENDNIATSNNLILDLLEANKSAGNQPVDMLFCVPPSLVRKNEKTISVPDLFQKWGLSIWDGTFYSGRDSYPTENDQLRIVQYESCRGLEGWSVVLFGSDEFYNTKLAQIQKFTNDDNVARLQVARWMLIPLTRAMDTLVIHVSSRTSYFKDVLIKATSRYSEFVEWHRY